MCVIIDTNMAHKFGAPIQEDVVPVVNWLFSKKKVNLAVAGGELKREWTTAGDGFRNFLRTLKQAGRLLDKDDSIVDAETEQVAKEFAESNYDEADDPHIIALARVSGARLLISADSSSGLHAIFKKRRFLDPPGKIYQNATHHKLLHRAPDCR